MQSFRMKRPSQQVQVWEIVAEKIWEIKQTNKIVQFKAH